MSPSPRVTAYRQLIGAFAFTLWAHGVALVAMVTLLDPGLDTTVTALERAQYVASHPWTWRLGWLPWQVTALSDVLVSVAFIRYTRTLPDRAGLPASWFALGATVAAFIPDQWGEAVWVTSYLELARAASAPGGDLHGYVAEEARLLLLTGSFGALGYTLMSLGWMKAAVDSAGGSRAHKAFVATGLGMAFLFVVTVIANWYTTNHATVAGGYPHFWVVFVFNGIAFPLLLVWTAWMAGVVGAGHHRALPRSDAQLHRLEWPDTGPRAALARAVNAPGLRDLIRASCPPAPIFQSRVTDVVYVNWLVPADRVEALLPPPLRLHCRGDRTWLTILTYQHHHFGPWFIPGPLRRLLPSPAQSNWRLYLQPESPQAAQDGIAFFKTTVGAPSVVVGARLMSDGLPAHLPVAITHVRNGDHIRTHIDPGRGSAPDLTLDVELGGDLHPNWAARLGYLIPQNRAIDMHTGHGMARASDIDIPVDLSTVQPVQVTRFQSQFLEPLVAGCPPFAFLVPALRFRAMGERWVHPASGFDPAKLPDPAA